MSVCAMESRIQRGNVERSGAEAELALYLGSGDFGGCFDAAGQQSRAFRSSKYGETCLMHKDFWHRGAFGLDYYTPIGRMVYADFESEDVRAAEQKLDIWNGRLSTSVWRDAGDFCIEATFHPYARDILGIVVSAAQVDALPTLAYRIDETLKLHYGQEIRAALTPRSVQENAAEMEYQAGNARGVILLRAFNAHVRLEEGRVVLRPEKGKGQYGLLFAAAGINRLETVRQELDSFEDAAAFFAAAAEGWHKRWGENVPDLSHRPWNALFLRSAFHILASWSPSDDVISPPCGWTGNAWPFAFPQDAAFIEHAVLALGWTDIAKARIDFFARSMDEMREYTRRVYGAEGIMWAWIYPIGPNSRVLGDGAPNACHYEIHNAVYPAQMAYETAEALGDRRWTVEIAWPIVRESARFFASVLKKEGSTWGIQVTPSMGQDEFGGENAKNYLCSLYAARYSLTLALNMVREYGVRLEEEETAHWEQILADGLAFDRLENAEFQVYQTCQAPNFTLGRMKHPIELLPWCTLWWPEKNQWEINAYNKRYQLCMDSERDFFHGWTLAKISCAEGIEGDEKAFANSFRRMLSSTYTDAEQIQLYETSQSKASSFYVTSEGLFAWGCLCLERNLQAR